MFGYDTSETLTKEVSGIPFQIGLLRDGRYEELVDRHTEALKELGLHEDAAHGEGETFDAVGAMACTTCRELRTKALPVMREIVREGVRGWPGPVQPEMVPFTWAGATYEVLSDATLDRLQVAGRGRLMFGLARTVLAVNRLDPKDVLGFLSSSGSPTAPTS